MFCRVYVTANIVTENCFYGSFEKLQVRMNKNKRFELLIFSYYSVFNC